MLWVCVSIATLGCGSGGTGWTDVATGLDAAIDGTIDGVTAESPDHPTFADVVVAAESPDHPTFADVVGDPVSEDAGSVWDAALPPESGHVLGGRPSERFASCRPVVGGRRLWVRWSAAASPVCG